MQSNKKGIVIAIAATLLAAFFMPWIKYIVGVSAWDMIFGDAGRSIDTPVKYLLVLIPVCAGIIVYNAGFNDENYPISKRLLFGAPLLSLLIVLVILFVQIEERGGRISDLNLDRVGSVLGIGFWLTLIGSVILPFVDTQPQKTAPTYIATTISKKQLGIGIIALGVILIIVSTQNQLFTKARSTSEEMYSIFMGENYNSRSRIDKVSKYLVLFSGLATTVLGGLLLYSRRNTIKAQLSPINSGASTFDWSNFFARHKIKLLSAVGVVVAFCIVYFVFLKAYPIKDAKKFSNNYCSCTDDLNKNNAASMKTYLDEFEGKRFASRLAARNALNDILNINAEKYDNCIVSAAAKFREKLADYQSSGGENATIFQDSYKTSIENCSGSRNEEAATLQNRINEKILAIIEPEPDLEKIKSDLIGREIPGWKFSYLSEYKNAEIVNKLRNGQRMEYRVKLALVDNNANTEHDCELMAVYFEGDDGWSLSDVVEYYITYTNTFYPDRYTRIVPFKGCTWSAENNFNMGWKTSDWSYASETVTGPSLAGVALPSSNEYYIRSLEDTAIKVKFTYKPSY